MNTHQGWRFHTIFTHHSAGEHSVELRMALTHRQVVAAVSKQLRQIKICYLYWFQNKADPIVAYVTWYKYCITASLLTPVYSGTYQQTQQDWAWDRGGKRERREKKRNDDDSDNDDKDDNDDDGIHSNYFVSAYKHSWRVVSECEHVRLWMRGAVDERQRERQM